MFERFTDRARRVVVLSQEEARLLNHNYIGTEHILLGLVHEAEGVAAKALSTLSISLEAVRSQVEEVIGQGGSSPSGHIPFTPRAKKVLELSLREALQLGHNYIGTEHILLGLVREGEGVAAQVLVDLGADLSRVRRTVIELLSGYSGPEPPTGEMPLYGLDMDGPSFESEQHRWLRARRVLSERSTEILERALGHAVATNTLEIEPEHILLALLGDDTGPVAAVIEHYGIDAETVRRLLNDHDPESDVDPSE